MAIIIAVFNQKGGCAKTQTTMQIGGDLGSRGYKVAIIDMDPQNTSLKWNGQATVDNPFPASVFSLSAIQANLTSEIRKHAPNYDFIMVDCPPAIESDAPWHALTAAHLAIMPILPDKGNIWAIEKAVQLSQFATKENPKLITRGLASRVPRGNAYLVCLEEIRDKSDLIMFKTQISDRVAYPESQIFGSCVSVLNPKSAATKEVKAVVDEILELIKE